MSRSLVSCLRLGGICTTFGLAFHALRIEVGFARLILRLYQVAVAFRDVLCPNDFLVGVIFVTYGYVLGGPCPLPSIIHTCLHPVFDALCISSNCGKLAAGLISPCVFCVSAVCLIPALSRVSAWSRVQEELDSSTADDGEL